MYRPTIEYKLCKLYLSITRFLISLTKSNNFNIGTKVIANGVVCEITQIEPNNYYMLRRVRRPKYSVVDFPLYANRAEIKKVKSFKNLWYDATYYWNWYRRNCLHLDAVAMSKGQQLYSVKKYGRK